MKPLVKIVFLIIVTVLFSCEGGESFFLHRVTFDSSFPKENKSLANILGSELIMKNGIDTNKFEIISTKSYNLIINSKTGDTVFLGKVCKFRGLYYFNRQFNDTTFQIYAVKISDNLIYGFSDPIEQFILVDEAILSGESKSLVRYVNADTTTVKLRCEKKEMRKLFNSIVNKFIPDTIISIDKRNEINGEITSAKEVFDPEESVFISKVYPNPIIDFINVELHEKGNVAYKLIGSNGKIVVESRFNDRLNKINIGNVPSGVYSLILTSFDNKQSEVIKIVKVD